ncbi:hypothetical protein HOLleu_25328 [Holothuria leucospilota]|uniref:Integrase zinc-binding domain-containing protein n=1 Tax=Holothuria leucospilota TaxID=206669 RepID=A0A9Q1H4G3_HOLLE|nr:hypothetical protein HOLleu_25328 [Holothuria leucospilota]
MHTPLIKGTQRLKTKRFIWPNINKDVENWCQSCGKCQHLHHLRQKRRKSAKLRSQRRTRCNYGVYDCIISTLQILVSVEVSLKTHRIVQLGFPLNKKGLFT